MLKIILVILMFWAIAGFIIFGIKSLTKETFNIYSTIMVILLLGFLIGFLILFIIVTIF